MPTYQEWLASQNQGRTAAQQAFNRAQANYNANPMLPGQEMGGGLSQGTRYTSVGAPNMAAYNAMNQAQAQLGAYDPNSAENQAAGNRYQAYDLAHAGVNRIANDPTDQFIRQALQTAAGPEGGPYNSTTRNAMFTGAMESSGAKAQAQSIMDSAAQRGIPVSDPSVQAALRNVQGQQAQAGQRARLGIDTVANPANYAAQQSAVNRLGDYNSSRQQQQQSAEDRLREMLWNEGFNRQVAGPQVAGTGNQSFTIGGPARQVNQSTGPWQGFSNANYNSSGWVPPRAPAQTQTVVQQPAAQPKPPTPVQPPYQPTGYGRTPNRMINPSLNMNPGY